MLACFFCPCFATFVIKLSYEKGLQSNQLTASLATYVSKHILNLPLPSYIFKLIPPCKLTPPPSPEGDLSSLPSKIFKLPPSPCNLPTIAHSWFASPLLDLLADSES